MDIPICQSGESDIESWCCDFAAMRGVNNFKLAGGGKTGKPDRVFLFPEGRAVFVEFKRPGEPLRKLQAWVAKQMRKKGHEVHRFDNAKAFVDTLFPDREKGELL